MVRFGYKQGEQVGGLVTKTAGAIFIFISRAHYQEMGGVGNILHCHIDKLHKHHYSEYF